MKSAADSTVDTAQIASEEALEAVYHALDARRNFKLEAGAGAGKTYTLIQALKYILERKQLHLPRPDQRVACLTYTKVARDEILSRTDDNPSIFADTLHGFLWEMIQPYQKALFAAILSSESWQKLLDNDIQIDGFPIVYDLGIRGIRENRITLHHDDIPAFAIKLFQMTKFRSLIGDRFPVIFVDEYQDTPAGLAEAILSGYESDRKSPVVGFFGDYWQQIYDRTCGSIEHLTVTPIPKNANFRSDQAVVSFLNRLRPELPQAPRAGAQTGTVTVYHTNAWPGERQTHQWKGQISHEATQACLTWLRTASPSSSWIRSSSSLKVLMLTHATIANELGYAQLAAAFDRNESFARPEDGVVEFFIGTFEPALEAFRAHKYGELFRVLGSKRPTIDSPKDKVRWTELFHALDAMSADGSVGSVLDLLYRQRLFALPSVVAKREGDLRELLKGLGPDEELFGPRKLLEYRRFREVPYREVRALRSYLNDNTPFSTKHSVKGAEFDDVIVLVGRGWARYDFAAMLSAHSKGTDPALKESKSFVASRNLFYVSASRAKHNLALLFVQDLDDSALDTLSDWVGPENLLSIEFADALTPMLSAGS